MRSAYDERRSIYTLFALAGALGILLAPSSLSAQVSLYGSTVKEHTVRPGGTAEGSIRLRNRGQESRRIHLYQTDYRFNADGESEYGAPGSIPRSNAGWISTPVTRTTIAPGEDLEIPYRIQVPGELEEAGSHWSMIMVEIRDGSVASSGDSAEGMSMGTRLRYGVQVATHLGDSGERDLAYSEQTVRTDGGEREFVLTVKNTGTRAVRPEMGLELYGSSGNRVLSEIEQRGLLYPGTSLRQTFALGELAEGSYQAMVLGDPGRGEVFAGKYRFDVSP